MKLVKLVLVAAAVAGLSACGLDFGSDCVIICGIGL